MSDLQAALTPAELALFERIAARIEPGAALVSWRVLRGGVSARTAQIELEGASGRQRFVVRRPRSTDEAAQLRQLARVHALVPMAPRAVLLVEPDDAQELPSLVLEFVEGAPDCSPADLDSYVAQIAERLARVHRLEGAPLARWADAPTLTASTALEALAAARPPVDPLEARIREALVRAPSPPEPTLPTLLHGDLWPGNLIWREGRLIAVIDWEDAALGDPLSDLAISRMELRWLFGEQVMKALTSQYQALTQRSLKHLPFWDLIAALRPIGRIPAWAEGLPPLGRPDVTAETMTRDHLSFVEAALAQLDAGGDEGEA